MKRKYLVLISILSVLLISSIGICISFSIYQDKHADELVTIVDSDENYSINYFNGKAIETASLQPNESYQKSLSITNVKTDANYVTIGLVDIAKNVEEMHLKVEDAQGIILYDKTIGSMDIAIVKTYQMSPQQTAKFTLTFTNLSDEPANMTASYLIYKETEESHTVTAKDKIMEDRKVGALKTKLAEQGTENGLLETEDDAGTSYYFRGEIDSNYFQIGDDMFRITRINGDGSIRLVYNYAIEGSYRYYQTLDTTKLYEHNSYKNSYAKQVLDTWMSDHLEEYKNYIVSTTVCVESSNTDREEYDSYRRVTEETIDTLKCKGEKESVQIGLLSVDEVIFAGAQTTGNNTKYFLYNSGITTSWWTASASQVIEKNNTVDYYTVSSQGAIQYTNKITNELGLRPVISIDKNATISGSGKLNDPYVIEK